MSSEFLPASRFSSVNSVLSILILWEISSTSSLRKPSKIYVCFIILQDFHRNLKKFLRTFRRFWKKISGNFLKNTFGNFFSNFPSNLLRNFSDTFSLRKVFKNLLTVSLNIPLETPLRIPPLVFPNLFKNYLGNRWGKFFGNAKTLPGFHIVLNLLTISFEFPMEIKKKKSLRISTTYI